MASYSTDGYYLCEYEYGVHFLGLTKVLMVWTAWDSSCFLQASSAAYKRWLCPSSVAVFGFTTDCLSLR